MVSLQISIQGAPFINKHIPFIFTGNPVDFAVIKFNTTHDLEKVSIRHSFHLNEIASVLFNYMGSLAVEDSLVVEKLNLQELGVMLASSVFKEGEHYHTECDSRLNIILRWLDNDTNRNTAKRDRDLITLLKSIELKEVEE